MKTKRFVKSAEELKELLAAQRVVAGKTSVTAYSQTCSELYLSFL